MSTTYKHLRYEERTLIQLGLERGRTIRETACVRRPTLAGGYCSVLAHQRAAALVDDLQPSSRDVSA